MKSLVEVGHNLSLNYENECKSSPKIPHHYACTLINVTLKEVPS